MNSKQASLRMCVSCRRMLEKNQLVRIVKNKNGEVQPDLTGKMPGRGAYICKQGDCLEKAAKGRRLERAFSSQMPQDIYESVKQTLLALGGGTP